MPETAKTESMSALKIWAIDHLVRIPFVQKMLFVHNLHIMIKAGLSLVGGLGILIEQIENKRLKKLVAGIKAEVEKGRPFNEVLAEYPKVFPPIYVSMVAAGEASGKMDEALEQVSEQMKKSHALTSRVQGAMIYPAVIFFAMGAIGIEMVVFVLPKIIVMFNEFNAELPLPTRILIAVVHFMENYALLVLLAAVGLVALFLWLKRKPPVKRVLHTLALKLPIFGQIIKKINLARFTLTLSSLLKSGIAIIEAIRITANVQTNVRYSEDLTKAAEILKKGTPLSEALGTNPLHFPPMVVQMLRVGEESGQVDTMLNELSAYYGDEVDTTMKNFSTIIEPIIILVLGLAVAGMAVAVIMPMYSLAQAF